MKKALPMMFVVVFAAGCATSADPPAAEKHPPRVQLSGENVSPEAKPLCQHAWKLYWESETGSDEEARAEDMIEAFC